MDKLETPYNNTNEDKEKFINEIKMKLPYFHLILPILYENGSFSATVYNETYHFSLLSNKKIYENLTYIETYDCEYLLKIYHNIDPNEELILFTIEYLREEYQIPILEYTVFTKNGKEELNISVCQHLNFTYYIPVDIRASEHFKYDFGSEYNNKICSTYTTENNTDIILYERRKEFNDYNMSICEIGCTYKGNLTNKALCECPVKNQFNKFLLEIEGNKEVIYKFNSNNFEPFNFGVIKCFKMMFTKENIKQNYGTITYLVILITNVLSLFLFFFKFYKDLFAQVKSLSESKQQKNILIKNDKNIDVIKNDKNMDMIKKNKKLDMIKKDKHFDLIEKDKNIDMIKKDKNVDMIKNGKNLIISGNNPPKKEINKMSIPKVNINNSNDLIDSKNQLNNVIGKSTLNLNKTIKNKYKNKNNNLLQTDMEINMLSYLEAKRTDKRGCFIVYLSFIKTRHIFISVFISNYNPLLFKMSFLFFVFGICLGINTIFFDDKVIQKIFESKGVYNIQNHIINYMIFIIISGIAASIIKSLVGFFSFTDVSVLKVKENTINIIEKDEKIEQAYDNASLRIARFYIISFILMGAFWLYVGSICVVFQNSQLYLIVNAAVSLVIVMILPFFYYLIPAMFRTIALNGKDSSGLYKFSQFVEQI